MCSISLRAHPFFNFFYEYKSLHEINFPLLFYFFCFSLKSFFMLLPQLLQFFFFHNFLFSYIPYIPSSFIFNLHNSEKNFSIFKFCYISIFSTIFDQSLLTDICSISIWNFNFVECRDTLNKYFRISTISSILRIQNFNYFLCQSNNVGCWKKGRKKCDEKNFVVEIVWRIGMRVKRKWNKGQKSVVAKNPE